jgi:hypothetical protein
MSATLQPFGLRPVWAPSQYSSATRYDGGIPSGYATTILQYQPVALNSSGQIIPVTTTSADLLGSFGGITYFDASGVPHTINQFVGGTTFQANQPIWVWVYSDPSLIYQIQCDGSLVQSIGGQLNFTSANLASGNSTVGLSQATAQAASLTTSGQGQLRITDLDYSIGNAWGDAFTIVNVQIARHQFVSNKVAV